MRVSPGILLVVLRLCCFLFLCLVRHSKFPSRMPAESVTIHPESDSLPTDPHAFYQKLNELRPDGTHVYPVQDLRLRRDAVSFVFRGRQDRFLPSLGGHVTGAVFTGPRPCSSHASRARGTAFPGAIPGCAPSSIKLSRVRIFASPTKRLRKSNNSSNWRAPNRRMTPNSFKRGMEPQPILHLRTLSESCSTYYRKILCLIFTLF